MEGGGGDAGAGGEGGGGDGDGGEGTKAVAEMVAEVVALEKVKVGARGVAVRAQEVAVRA